MGTAHLLSMFLGFIAGVEAAWRRGGIAEKAGVGSMTVLEGVPEIGSGVILLLVFALYLGWFPAAGAETAYAELSAGRMGRGRAPSFGPAAGHVGRRLFSRQFSARPGKHGHGPENPVRSDRTGQGSASEPGPIRSRRQKRPFAHGDPFRPSDRIHGHRSAGRRNHPFVSGTWGRFCSTPSR